MTDTTSPTIEELDSRAGWALLGEHQVGRLGVIRQGQPEIYPINYVVMQGRIRLRTVPGAKLLGVILGGRVAFEVDGIEGDTAWSVLVKGTAEEVQLSPDRTVPPTLPATLWVPGSRDSIVEITPVEITARRFRRAG